MVSAGGEFRRLLESSEESYYRGLSIALWAFAAVFTAAICVAVGIVQCLKRTLRGRYVHESQQHHHPSTEQRSRQIAVFMPVHIYEAGPSSSAGADTTFYELQTCAICLGEFENGECVSALPRCKHMFHNDCIKQWLPVMSVNCPICRVPAVDRDACPARTTEGVGVEIPSISAWLALNFSSSGFTIWSFG